MAEEVKPENILEELNKAFFSGTHDSFSKYTSDVQNFGHTPDNQFDHAWGLIKSRKRDFDKEKLALMNDPMIYLGNVENSRMLRFYQNDVFYLINMLSMSLNDEVMRCVFEPLNENFKIEIRMTCNIDNAERHLQAFQMMNQEKKRGFGILSKKKQKKIDYVVPTDDEVNSNMY